MQEIGGPTGRPEEKNQETGGPTGGPEEKNQETGEPTVGPQEKNQETGEPTVGPQEKNQETGEPTVGPQEKNQETGGPTVGLEEKNQGKRSFGATVGSIIERYGLKTTKGEYSLYALLCYGFTSVFTALMLSIGGRSVFEGIKNASQWLGNLIERQNIPLISQALPELFFGFSHLANIAELNLGIVSGTFVSIFPKSMQSGITHFANVYAHWWIGGLGIPYASPEGLIRMFTLVLIGLFAARKYKDLNRLKFSAIVALLSAIDFGFLVFPLGIMALRSDFDPKKSMVLAIQDLHSSKIYRKSKEIYEKIYEKSKKAYTTISALTSSIWNSFTRKKHPNPSSYIQGDKSPTEQKEASENPENQDTPGNLNLN